MNKSSKPISETHPDLAKEAHGWDPSKVIAGTRKKLEWKCHLGHVWEARGENRVNGTGCPFCSHHRPLQGFNDLATTHPELAKEADGWDPKNTFRWAGKRLAWKCSQGHTYTAAGGHRKNGTGCPICANKKVESGFNDFATTHPEFLDQADGWDPTTVTAGSHQKLSWKCKKGHKWKATGSQVTRGGGCPVCANKKIVTGVNDLATTHPEIAKEADGWDPKTVIGGTRKSLSWQCSQGHKWKARGSSRIGGSKCTICVNRKVETGFNDLATTHPDLAKEAFGWDPTTVIAGTYRKLAWKCSEGHVWSTTGGHRIQGRGCPSCAKTGFDPNQNGYVYFLIQPNWEIYQIGITNVPEDRLKSHSRNGFELLELRGPMDGYLTQEIEQSILRFLKSKNVNLPSSNLQGKFDGYTESWTMESFQVNNLKELIDMASDAGF